VEVGQAQLALLAPVDQQAPVVVVGCRRHSPY
jgi:hypothetical protein